MTRLITVTIAILAVVAPSSAQGQQMSPTKDLRWQTVGVGPLSSRPSSCRTNRDVYICNGAGCNSNGEYHYCTAADTWNVAGAGPHALLSGTHTDTTAAAPSRGDLATAQGTTPTWQRLPIGQAGYCLTSNGVDALWAACPTASIGVDLLNGLSTSTQSMTANPGDAAVTDFTITSSGSVHQFRFPNASANSRGLLASTDWLAFNGKANAVHAHAASDITSGILTTARGGTGSDFSVTGGPGQYLKQVAAGANVTTGNILSSDLPANARLGSIGFVADGGGSALTSGITSYVQVPYDCTITGWTMLADTPGSATVDVWRGQFTTFPHSAANSITGTSGGAVLTNAVKSTSAVLAGWTTQVSAGDIVTFSLGSATGMNKLTVVLKVVKN